MITLWYAGPMRAYRDTVEMVIDQKFILVLVQTRWQSAAGLDSFLANIVLISNNCESGRPLKAVKGGKPYMIITLHIHYRCRRCYDQNVYFQTPSMSHTTAIQLMT